jgi:hypothetical protein
VKYLDVLHTIYARLSGRRINWAVTGSLSLALQGVPVEIHDIDIMTDKTGAYDVENLFSEFVSKKVKYSCAERIRSHFGALIIDGIRVEIMGDVQIRLDDGTWEDPVDLRLLKKNVQIEEMQLPVIRLDREQQAYAKLGRAEKTEVVKKWLSSHGEM